MDKSKTKVMVVSPKKQELQVVLDQDRIEQLSCFQYLGIILDETGKRETEMKNRIEIANKVFYALNRGVIKREK